MLTYSPAEASRFPAFLDKRVYQGSSGRVYPIPFIEAVDRDAHHQEWLALHLENEYLRLMILPSLGGRIHVAYDKLSGRDLFYRNNVIKPALVGLAGPWISGGVEFNWPQHHRPSTYLPVDWSIEEEDDGSVTVWCSDHDPQSRLKGMHGIRLRPGSAIIEARVRLFNRTPLTQTFLWWANVAAAVHDDYQSFFPTDVHVVADHAKRAVSTFPRAEGRYYGVDYPSRVTPERPDGDRLDWYRNIPVPTSYMCLGTDDDFFGGYDHAANLGFVHVADHHIAPGKKQWTWGNDPFGWAWDRNLTDGDGPYVELMAGVYTDNQPDFAWLLPGETKTFSQFWYPIHEIGIPQQATKDAAVHVAVERGAIEFAIAGSRAVSNVQVSVLHQDVTVWREEELTLTPGTAVRRTVALEHAEDGELELVISQADAELLRWHRRNASDDDLDLDLAEPATEIPAPETISSNDELYLAGVHLAQYRHATRDPEPYWEEALRRDPGDSRSGIALAERRLHAGRVSDAIELLERAIARQTHRNPNPRDGESYYLLGVARWYAGETKRADDAFAKSAWNAAWRGAAELLRARIAASEGNWAAALVHAENALHVDSDQLQAAAIRVIALRRTGGARKASIALAAARQLDPLDAWLSDLDGGPVSSSPDVVADIAVEYFSLGLWDDVVRLCDVAIRLETEAPVNGMPTLEPVLRYRQREALAHNGDSQPSLNADRSTWAERSFVSRLEDALLLDRVTAHDNDDAQAAATYGHWLQAHGRFDDAKRMLDRASRLRPSDSVAWRGLGMLRMNVDHDASAAADAYAHALAASPADPRLLLEADQLARLRGVDPQRRLAALENQRSAVAQRDDLLLVFAELHVLTRNPEQAVALLRAHAFQPWEGGEGETIRVWTSAHLMLARRALAGGRPDEARELVDQALNLPESLGEERHPLANLSDVLLLAGDGASRSGDTHAAFEAWTRAAESAGDFTTMSVVPFSSMTYYSATAARRLGDESRALGLLEGLATYADHLRASTPKIDYFATSLPELLTFDDDLIARRDRLVALLDAQLALATGSIDSAREHLARVLAEDPADAHAAALLETAIDRELTLDGFNA
ncbi:DUF5107 domain-containing protein [Leifsonia sp. NPDC056665]|uniref:DUF5107 domain-containing protein n=1 Tax=Leifsonia sp. NPDC056665 TaxID=3345901 RepID=UPI003687164F